MRLELEKWFFGSLNKVSSGLRFLNHPLLRILLLVFIVAYIALKSFISPHDHWRTAESFILLCVALALILYPRDRYSEYVSFVYILILVFSPFYWRLQGFDTDGFSIGGILPQSDANGYFTGALRILYGEKISPFAARRPLFVAFLSVLIYVFGQNLVLLLMIFALFMSFSIFMLMKEVKKGFGILPSALLAGMLIYNYTGRFVGKFLTEQVGLLLGMLSLTLFLRGIREQKYFYFPAALLSLSFALNARAGAFFVLPFLILWVVILAGKSLPSIIRFGFLNLGVVIGGFAVNFWLFKSVSSPDSLPFGNFGMTLYGMVTGYRGWRSFLVDYPGVPESEALHISLQIFWNSPGAFFRSVLQAYLDYLDPAHFFSFLYIPQKHLTFIAYSLVALTIVGLVRLFLHRRSLLSQMMFSVLVGIILSIPFVPPIDDGVRAMAATNPFLALLVGISLAGFGALKVESLNDQSFKPLKFNGLLLFTLIWLVTLSVGWLPVEGALQTRPINVVCESSESLVAVVSSPGSHVSIVKNSSGTFSLFPSIRKEDWRKNLANFPPVGAYAAFRQLEIGHGIFLGLNLTKPSQEQLVWFIAPTDLIQTTADIENYCAVGTGVPEFDEANFLLEQSLRDLFVSR